METIWLTLVAWSWVIVYGFLIILLPGYSLANKLPINRLEKLILGLVSGFSLFSVVVYLVRFIHLPFFVAELILIAVVYYFRPRISKPRFNTTKGQLAFFLIAIVIAISQSVVLWRSGIITEEGIRFVGLSFHDTMQHVTIIERLYESSDINHPGFSGADFNNYHYLIDSSLAAITRFSFVSLFDVYYRVYPLVISLLFSSTIFTTVRRFTKNEKVSLLAVLFTILPGNASFFMQFFRGEEFQWGSYAYLINPIFDILQNPAATFVLAQFLWVLFFMYLLEKKSSLWQKYKYWILALLIPISGSMIGMKAWGGLIIAGGLSVYAFWLFVTKKKSYGITIWVLTILVSLILFLPHYDRSSSASPVWAPGWSLRKMYNDSNRWNRLEDIFLEEHYIYVQSYHRLALLYGKWVLVYLVGNYWIRVIGFFGVLSLLVIKRTKISAFELSFISILLTSFSLPLFFNQGAMAYDIEQFSPYAVVLSAISTSIIIYKLLKWVEQRTHRGVAFSILLVVLLLSVPSNFTSFKDRAIGDTRVISNAELDAYKSVNQLPKDAIVLLYPSDRTIANLEFTAFTGRDTYFSGRTLSTITGDDNQGRIKTLHRFFDSMSENEQREFLEKNGISHLFLYNEDSQLNKRLPAALKIIFENDEAVLYEVTI